MRIKSFTSFSFFSPGVGVGGGGGGQGGRRCGGFGFSRVCGDLGL